jgi:hypothetical protein
LAEEKVVPCAAAHRGAALSPCSLTRRMRAGEGEKKVAEPPLHSWSLCFSDEWMEVIASRASDSGRSAVAPLRPQTRLTQAERFIPCPARSRAPAPPRAAPAWLFAPVAVPPAPLPRVLPWECNLLFLPCVPWVLPRDGLLAAGRTFDRLASAHSPRPHRRRGPCARALGVGFVLLGPQAGKQGRGGRGTNRAACRAFVIVWRSDACWGAEVARAGFAAAVGPSGWPPQRLRAH